MISWNEFAAFAIPALLLWLAASWCAWKRQPKAAILLSGAGLCVYAAFIVALWMSLQRPPLRTLGETRLWYAFFMMLSGLATYWRQRYRWILFFSAVVATVFIALNLFKPEIHDQTLMPALQSGWFVPHVTVYMFSYSVLGCAFLLAVAGCVQHTDRYLPAADRLVYTGMAFLTFGMLSGALWAKEAWGDYWTWDPKETWAAVTWSTYLLYIHLRLYGKGKAQWANLLLIIAFLGLQMCWYGVNYLPAAQNSMHTYSNT